MYDKFKYLGKSLREWQILLHNEYTLGELYLMAMAEENLFLLIK